MGNIDQSAIVLYTSNDGSVKLDVHIDENTVWLSQLQMGTLYGRSKSTINEHLTDIFREGELDSQVVVRNFRTTTQHGAIEGKTQDNDTQAYLETLRGVAKEIKPVK